MRTLSLIIFSMIILSGCSSGKSELYSMTDAFVESLQSEYESYGIMGASHKRETKDGYYQVMPIGRLINIKIMENVSDDTYKSLQRSLKSRYSGDSRVKDVFINLGGTVMIDCRR